jgi:hypothetical protein
MRVCVLFLIRIVFWALICYLAMTVRTYTLLAYTLYYTTHTHTHSLTTCIYTILYYTHAHTLTHYLQFDEIDVDNSGEINRADIFLLRKTQTFRVGAAHTLGVSDHQ